MTRYKSVWIKHPSGRKGKSMDLHRLIYTRKFGPLPRNVDVHHINGDRFDNRLSNLTALPRSIHFRVHLPELWRLLKKTGDWLRRCSSCKVFKPLEKFYWSKDTYQTVNGEQKTCKRVHGYCKDCFGIRERYYRNRTRNDLLRKLAAIEDIVNLTCKRHEGGE